MSEAVVAVHMPDSLLQSASAEANRRGVSVEEWLLKIAEERVLLEQRSERFFRLAAQRTPEENCRTLRELLDKAPDGPPMPGDELE